jgi:hypothetical protein
MRADAADIVPAEQPLDQVGMRQRPSGTAGAQRRGLVYGLGSSGPAGERPAMAGAALRGGASGGTPSPSVSVRFPGASGDRRWMALLVDTPLEPR